MPDPVALDIAEALTDVAVVDLTVPRDGGPAFARAGFYWPRLPGFPYHASDGTTDCQEGMKTRTFMATQIAAGYVAGRQNQKIDPAETAKISVAIADALIAALGL